MLTHTQIDSFKKILDEEKKLLETELSELGSRNPSNLSDWIPSKTSGEEFGADANQNADIIEDMQDNSGALNELEERLRSVVQALERIHEGTYGVCEVSNEPIEIDRLNANPAASTCTKHMG